MESTLLFAIQMVSAKSVSITTLQILANIYTDMSSFNVRNFAFPKNSFSIRRSKCYVFECVVGEFVML